MYIFGHMVAFGIVACLVGCATMVVSAILLGAVTMLRPVEWKEEYETGLTSAFRCGVAIFFIGLACVLAGGILGLGAMMLTAFAGVMT